jgi:hypothetical protein
MSQQADLPMNILLLKNGAGVGDIYDSSNGLTWTDSVRFPMEMESYRMWKGSCTVGDDTFTLEQLCDNKNLSKYNHV